MKPLPVMSMFDGVAVLVEVMLPCNWNGALIEFSVMPSAAVPSACSEPLPPPVMLRLLAELKVTMPTKSLFGLVSLTAPPTGSVPVVVRLNVPPTSSEPAGVASACTTPVLVVSVNGPFTTPLMSSGVPAGLAMLTVPRFASSRRLLTWLAAAPRFSVLSPPVARVSVSVLATTGAVWLMVPKVDVPTLSVTLGAASCALMPMSLLVSATEARLCTAAPMRMLSLMAPCVSATSEALLSVTGDAIEMVRLLSVSVEAAPPAATVSGAITLTSLVACSVTSPVASSVATRAAVIWLVGVKPKSPYRICEPTRSSPVGGTPSTLATVPTCRLFGSSRRLPARPAGARVSTAPAKSSSCLPETSTRPPSPRAAPPRASICPSKRVWPSDQTTTWPPSPLPRALASTSAPPAT